MSTFLYGRMSATRLGLESGETLVVAGVESAQEPKKKADVLYWLDMLAALVPVELLALHALAMTLGTSTEGSGEDAVVTFTASDEMFWVFCALAAGTVVVYLAGARSFTLPDYLRAVVASIAFGLWTMIQPFSAFDALPWDPSPLVRGTIAAGGAVIVGIFAAALARQAQMADSHKEQGPER